jgi:hypothetical protein
MKKKIAIASALLVMVVLTQATVMAQAPATQSAKADEIAKQFQQAMSGSGAGEISPLSGTGATGPMVKPIDGQMVPPYNYGYNDVQVTTLRGVAVDSYYLNTKPVVFLRIAYNGNEFMYLLVGSDMYKMSLLDVRNDGYNWVLRLNAENGNNAIVLAHEANGVATISATFGNLLINFEPVQLGYPTYVTPVNMTEPRPVCGVSGDPIPCGTTTVAQKEIPIPVFSQVTTTNSAGTATTATKTTAARPGFLG